MYGLISDDGKFICNRAGTKVYSLRKLNQRMAPFTLNLPEIDEWKTFFERVLHRKFIIHQFTEEEIKSILIQKLKGY